MRSNLFHNLILLLSLSLTITSTGCSLIPSETSYPQNETPSLSVRTTVPTLESNPTKTKSLLLPSQTAAPTTRSGNFQRECLTIDETKNFNGTQGTIAVLDDNNKLSLLNLETRNMIALGRTEILNGALSDGWRLAYIDTDLQKLLIVSSSGDILSTMSVPKNWIEVLDLVDNIVLLSNIPIRQDGSWAPPSSTIALNLLDNTYSEFLPEYPEIYSYASGPPNMGRYFYSITAYDPTQNYVVYPAETDTDSKIVLFDIRSHRQIVRLQMPFPWNAPIWRNDGEAFLISIPIEYSDWQGKVYKNVMNDLPYVGGNELFVVDKNGDIKRISFLTTKFPADEQSYVWSPNNKMIAFWLKVGVDNAQWQLSTLNVDTGDVTSYCIDGDGLYPIFWSKDGTRIITTVQGSNGDTNILLIDIQKKTAIRVTKKAIAMGWLRN